MKVLSKLDLGNNSIESASFELVPVISGGVENDIVKIGANGRLVDSGVSISDKQDALVSGTNIKTINNQSILGEGNITIEGGGGTSVQADWEQDDSSAADYIKHKPDMSGFLNENALETYLTTNNYTTTADLPDVSSFITENDLATYLTTNNYATESDIPDVSDFITESNLSTYLSENNYATTSDIPDVSDFVTESHVYEMGFATSSEIADFVTESDVANYLSNEGYVTNSDISSFVTESDVAEYLSDEGYMTQSDVADYLSNEAYVTESFLSDSGYVTEEFLSINEYINASNIEDAISTYLSDFITGDVLVKYVADIDAKPNYATVAITDTDTQGSYTYTIDTSSLNIGEAPIVQVTYNGQVLFTDITITIDSSNSEIVVIWDDTKYSVDSNNPLTVVIIGQAPAQQ